MCVRAFACARVRARDGRQAGGLVILFSCFVLSGMMCQQCFLWYQNDTRYSLSLIHI